MKRLLLALFFYVQFSLTAQEKLSIKVPNYGCKPIQPYTVEQIKKLEMATDQSNPQVLTSSIYCSLSFGSSSATSPEVGTINRFKDLAVNFFTCTTIIPINLYILQKVDFIFSHFA